ncbi:M1 family metallopeptidase [Virgisporangium aurantiacum]|uniref:Aminopeptidase N n=1 Tax=Virgisporangium aurantiacum TaxID=175570 RepID=A0A8J3ZE83_9ACTN|nr:M1 family metallopeptidase [Virgisporangium aurantiacum]GIJ62296.1 peptidase [Virgisporangium aurantiacum]
MSVRIRATVGALVVGLVNTLFVAPANAEPAPGAPGLGDPIRKGAGNGGYTVDHYDIRLTYQPDTDHLSGRTTISAVATQDLSQFNLDFALKVTAVRVAGADATFRYDAADKTELVVAPSAAVAKNQRFEVVVDYADTPSTVTVDTVQVWVRTPTGGVAYGQPRSAETWFPSNDHPSDKATYTISAAVPDGHIALSNGTVTRTPERPGWTRWNWRTQKPMTTYLPFIALGKFEFNEGTSPSGLPCYTAYDNSLGDFLPVAKQAIERTPEIVDYFGSTSVFGPYPFESIGGVAVPKQQFAIENQTRPVYGTYFWDKPDDPIWVVAHEQAHQWFGDSVSIGNWAHMWLNEGFATYGEWLWAEHSGRATADEIAAGFYNKYSAADDFWKLQVAPSTRLFDPPIYERGAMALHALRTEVGDDAFFRILQGFHLAHRDANVVTDDFIARAERVSGRQLDALFKTWLVDPVKPPVGPNGAPVATTAAIPSVVEEMAEIHKNIHAPAH